MTSGKDATVAERYREAVLGAAARDLGVEIPTGTVVVPSPERSGSTIATAYPLAATTIVWCSPQLAPQLGGLAGGEALTADEFAAEASRLGATFVGAGRNRVMTGSPNELEDARYRVVDLDRDRPADRDLLADFLDAVPEDDADEAELDLEDLDPRIVVLLDDAGAVASYASGRPWSIDVAFDDIAVLTHPEHRGRSLGAVAVSEFVRRHQSAGRLCFYNCNDENIGSNRVAEAVGFELMHPVVAYDFG